MSDTNINKLEPQPHYGYTPKGKVEGGKNVGEVSLNTKGDLAPIDQLAPSPKMNRPVKTPQIDAPELPIPTPKALRVASTKRESIQSAIVKEGTMKTEGLQNESQVSIVKAIEQNPWLKNKNLLGAMLQVSFEVLDNIRDARFSETEMKRNVEEKMFSLGMQNADLAKAMKDTAAIKEFIRAATSFVSALTSAVQLGTTIQGKAAAKKELEMPGEIGDRMNTQKQKVDSLKSEQINAGTDVTQTKLYQDDLHNYNLATQQLPPLNPPPIKPDVLDPKYAPASYDAQIKADEKDLNKLKDTYDQAFYRLRGEKTEIARSMGEMFKGLSDGVSGVIAGVYTQKEGVMEKDKARNETMVQMFNKLSDSINKSKDDFQSQFDKTTQQLIQMIADINKAHMLGRG